MSVTAGVSDTVIAVRDKLRGKIGQTKVKRYWPGKAPEWADENDEGGDIRMTRGAAALEKAFPNNEGSVVTRKDDPRLRRLAQSRIDNRDEYETDSEEEMTGVAMVKPVFVPKSERDTIAERERLEAEERALEEEVRRRIDERKRETKEIVVEKIKEDLEIQKNMDLESNIADVDTDDDVNEAEEYEAWKSREIARIKRDREDREAMLKEKEEIEKVRNMTEEERREWERKNPKPSAQSKQKWRFMQKYYHKGAFFQSDADDYTGTAGAQPIYARDFSAPTGEDKMDKTILPKVMQVKHFGRSGRTKWTHLVNEDTTDWNTPWTYNDPLRAKYNQKMAGMNAPIEKPKGSKKLKDWESR
ncbi:microfibrillar-associated protein-like protein [Perilla frutescens var. frutescens]|nr:microfibrillar-associated protein-like protein [Perilla frutescens var. frutescens]